MDSYHVFWLLDELKILVQNKVITEETAGRISEYYKNTAPKPPAPKADNAGREIQMQPTSGTAENIYQHINRQKPGSKKPLLTAASIPVLLSVIAAVLIAAGTISLAAYNWNVIPRTVKAFIAFILLIAVQSAGTFICLKGEKFAKGRWREGAAVLWSLMFGGVVAFISQICRLPGDTASFLLVWAVSSIILTYTMESLGAFAISLLLSASYIVTCRAGVSSSGAEALLFYLMLIALCPFSLRFEYGSRIMLIFASCMLGFTLEKSIPGLWTVCSVSFTVFSLEFSLSRGYRKLATFSAASLCILLLVLSYNSVWCGIGWQNIRKSHSIVGIVTDIAVALGLTGAAVALPLTDFRRKKIAAWQLVYPFCALAVMLLFIIYGFFDNKTQLSTCLAPTVIVLIFSVLFLAHILHSRKTYSIFLLFFLFCSSVITGLNIPVFAIALLLLLLEATGTFPSSVVRGAVFAFLLSATACMTLQESPSWHGASMLHYALFKPEALPWQIGLYALYLVSLICLFIKKKTLAKSADIIAVCAAIILLSSLDMTFSIGKHQMCMCYFCLVLFTSTYHLINLKGERPFTSNLIAFTALTVYFFWTAAFVMKLNLPAVSVSSFLLLFEAVCRFRASKIDNAKEKHAILVFSRVLTAIWMLAALFIAENETAMTVYDKDSMPFQAVSCILIVLLATILFILSHGWKDSLDIILIHAAILLLCAWSEHYPFTVFSLESKFLLLFTAASVYAFVRIRIYGHPAYLPYMAVFVIGIGFILYRFTGRFFLGSPLVPLFTGLYYYGKENVLAKKTKGAQSGTVIWEVLCAVFILASSLTDRNFDHSGPLWHYGGTAAYISVYLSMLFCVLLILLPAIALLQKRIMCNYLLLVYSVTLLVCDAIWISTGRHGISSVMSFVSFACVFLLAGYYIWEAYTEGKLAKANVAACYAALALVIKFFSDDYGFVAKGILFIALGIAMLLLNIFLYKTERQKKTAEEANGNE